MSTGPALALLDEAMVKRWRHRTRATATAGGASAVLRGHDAGAGPEMPGYAD